MKRFILSLTAAAVLSMPMAASALEKMDNNQLKSSTGQAGVSIAVDDIVIYQKSLADTTYWDTDGIGDENAAGIMIDQAEEMSKLITIDAILNAEEYGISVLQDEFGFDDNIGILEMTIDGSANPDLADQLTGIDPSDGSTGNFTNGISPLTIDVGTCEALTAGWDYNTPIAVAALEAKIAAAQDAGETDKVTELNTKLDGLNDKAALDVGGVVIGLPTVEIKTYSTVDFKTIKLKNGKYSADTGLVDKTTDAQHFNADHAFITVEKSGNSTMAILGGRLEIAPH